MKNSMTKLIVLLAALSGVVSLGYVDFVQYRASCTQVLNQPHAIMNSHIVDACRGVRPS